MYFIHQNFFVVDLLLGIGAFLLMIIFAILSTDSKERKMSFKKKPKSRSSNKQSKLSFYLAGGVVILLLSVAYLNAKSEGLTQKSRVQNYNYSKKALTPTPLPTPTTRPKVKGSTKGVVPTTNLDPIITCKSKTGDIQVRRSICRSYTDCPDGSGGYVFESQEDCKKRMEKLGQELADVVRQWGDAYLENSRLQQELMFLEAENKFNQSLFETQQQAQQLLESVPEPDLSVEPFPTIPPSTPEPTPNYEGTIVY